jgi:lipid-A-disaccharide synthase
VRGYLYYVIGFLPSAFFVLRFLIQWLKSEKQKRVVVDSLFWKLSFAGNLLLATHYFIQMQYPFLMLQTINGFIAWRNLNLNVSKRAVFWGFGLLLAAVTVAYCIQDTSAWLQIPAAFLEKQEDVSLLWHVVGVCGGVLFGARFWLQWWETEKSGVSQLGRNFWLLSIGGSLITLLYFARIQDSVSLVNAACGLVPYVRNLMLLRPVK